MMPFKLLIFQQDCQHLIDGGHAAGLVVDGIESLLRGSGVVVDDLPAVGHRGMGPHKHDGAVGLHLLTHLLVCDALLHIKQEDPACNPNLAVKTGGPHTALNIYALLAEAASKSRLLVCL